MFLDTSNLEPRKIQRLLCLLQRIVKTYHGGDWILPPIPSLLVDGSEGHCRKFVRSVMIYWREWGRSCKSNVE